MLVTEAPNTHLTPTPAVDKPAAQKTTGQPLPLAATDPFARRHIGPNLKETREMLDLLGLATLEALTNEAVPESIRLTTPLRLPAGRTESEVLAVLKEIASQNQVFRSYIGTGYSDCLTPAVIQRGILENP